jgi:hypothetical protein
VSDDELEALLRRVLYSLEDENEITVRDRKRVANRLAREIRAADVG